MDANKISGMFSGQQLCLRRGVPDAASTRPKAYMSALMLSLAGGEGRWVTAALEQEQREGFELSRWIEIDERDHSLTSEEVRDLIRRWDKGWKTRPAICWSHPSDEICSQKLHETLDKMFADANMKTSPVAAKATAGPCGQTGEAPQLQARRAAHRGE